MRTQQFAAMSAQPVAAVGADERMMLNELRIAGNGHTALWDFLRENGGLRWMHGAGKLLCHGRQINMRDACTELWHPRGNSVHQQKRRKSWPDRAPSDIAIQ